MKKHIIVASALATILFVSAVSLVYVQHMRRAQYVELQDLVRERDRLQMEWEQLGLEKSTWATHARIDVLAKEKLRLEAPSAAEIVVVTQ